MEVCQICKQKMEIVSEYHCATHGITRENYRAQYGRVYCTSISILPAKKKSEIDYIAYLLDKKDKIRKKDTKWIRK